MTAEFVSYSVHLYFNLQELSGLSVIPSSGTLHISVKYGVLLTYWQLDNK